METQTSPTKQRRIHLQKMCTALLAYYHESRDAGHTKLLIHGTKSQRCVILADTESHAESLQRDIAANHMQHQTLPNHFLGLENVTHLHGVRLPLAIDNAGMVALLREVVAVLSDVSGEEE